MCMLVLELDVWDRRRGNRLGNEELNMQLEDKREDTSRNRSKKNNTDEIRINKSLPSKGEHCTNIRLKKRLIRATS